MLQVQPTGHHTSFFVCIIFTGLWLLCKVNDGKLLTDNQLLHKLYFLIRPNQCKQLTSSSLVTCYLNKALAIKDDNHF
ncbi:hypothetical protein BCV72DRAFT_316312, partial [Rhizopus microsporus var. microsporus]